MRWSTIDKNILERIQKDKEDSKAIFELLKEGEKNDVEFEVYIEKQHKQDDKFIYTDRDITVYVT